MEEFAAFVRFAWWSFRINLCDWLGDEHRGWCGIHGDAPETLDERWWDLFGWKRVD